MASRTNITELTSRRKALLFDHGKATVFAVVDGASVPQLLDYLYTSTPPVFECLYRGELAPDLAEVAPYLVSLEADSKFTDWLIQSNVGKPWGSFLFAAADIRIVRQHFRRFLTVYHEETGTPLVFRFYDPRVLRSYLPSCNPEELTAFFGPVSRFMVDSDDPDVLLEFQLASGSLRTSEKKISEVRNAFRRPHD